MRPQQSALHMLLLLLQSATVVNSHGFLSTPRSRNLVAHEDRVYHPIASTDPLPEDCPNCLNRGGTLARCGVLHPGSTEERNYDLPKNALGGVMERNIQATFYKGQVIEVEVELTAHHKGHFIFKACAINSTTEIPTQACFDANPLTFISDSLYGAVLDVNYPERAYVAPDNIASKVYSTRSGFTNAMLFNYKLQLPPNINGELVLLQWYYVASNSACVHPGYDEYEWPEEWISKNDDGDSSEWDQKANVGTGLKMCDEVLPPDGDGLPEQFWNCAEISISPDPPPPREETASFTITPRPHSKTIIGYYASWQWYDRNKLAEPTNMDFTKITRVNFAFFQTDKEGNLWGTDSWADPNLLYGPFNWNPPENEPEYCSWDTPNTKTCKTHHYTDGLIHQAHAAGAQIYPSLGGWSLSDPFPEMASNPIARQNFATKCIELIEDYNFDGIDIDWEYPGYEDHSGTPADTVNYNLLLRELREKLNELGDRTGKFYGLTAALPCGPNNIANIDIESVAKYLTEFNLMTYDFFGAWSATTGANAPLYNQPWGDDTVKDFSVDGCVRNWIKGGGSPSAINIGLPFYGRSFLKAKGLNEKHEGNDKNTWFWDDGSPQYFNIVDKLPELVSVRHELTKTQYAYKDSSMGGLVSYDDEEAICDKTEYCLDNDLNGFIIWELSGDLMEDLSTPLLDAMNNKLIDPTLDCTTLAYNPNIISEDSTVSVQQSSSSNMVSSGQSNVEQNLPAPAPTTPAPTAPLYCPENATGPRQHDGCTGYYYCVYGTPKYPVISCPEGTLFDEKSMLCLYSETVKSCSGTSSPTDESTFVPTDQPTEWPTIGPSPSPVKPGTDRPVFGGAFVLLGDKDDVPAPSGQISLGSFTAIQSPPTRKPASKPSRPKPPKPRPTPSKQPTLTPLITRPAEYLILPSTATANESNGDASSEYCPDDYTGVLPWNDCTEYFYCIYSVPHLPTIHCEGGTLFDVDSKKCVDASQVTCSPNAAAAATMKTKQPSKSPSNLPTTQSPIAQPVSKQPSTSPAAQAIPDNNNSTLDQSSPTTSSTEPFVEIQQTTSADPKPAPALPGSLSDDNVSSYYWSSTTNSYSSSSSSSTSEGSNTPNSPFPSNFALDGPFITIEISFHDAPGDIGWQLLSLDGTVNVAKHTGAYTSMQPQSIVYEWIALQTDSTSILGLKWTILNVRGKGLSGGHWKIYSGSPIDSNLLVAMRNNFEYMDTVGLAVTNNGVISLLNDSPSSEQPGNHSAPDNSIPSEDTGRDDTSKLAASVNPDEYQYNTQPTDDKNGNNFNSLLIPVLVSLVTVALCAGLCLLVVAFKTPPPDYDGSVIEEDETNFDEWNIEEGGTMAPEQQFYAEYAHDMPVAHAFYAEQYGGMIDPPDDSVFNGYEKKPDAIDFSSDDAPPEEAFDSDHCNAADWQQQSDEYLDTTESTSNDPSHNPSLYVEEENQIENDIDEEETKDGLEQILDNDIYSVLEKLEEEGRGREHSQSRIV